MKTPLSIPPKDQLPTLLDYSWSPSITTAICKHLKIGHYLFLPHLLIYSFQYIPWILTRSKKPSGNRICQYYEYMHAYKSMCLIYNM